MVLFVLQFSPVCNFGKFDHFGLGTVRSERVILFLVSLNVIQPTGCNVLTNKLSIIFLHALMLSKGGEIRDKKTLNLSRNIISFQVFGRCFSFFTLQDQLVAQQKHLLRV